MKLYVFSSYSLNNIWAGIGANKWAVQVCKISNLKTNALNMKLGSLGIFYCSETQVFTTPFIVTKEVEDTVITNIWPEEWIYPFGIKALGNPNKIIHKDNINILKKVSNSSRYWNHEMSISPTQVFVPIDISTDDWRTLMKELFIN